MGKLFEMIRKCLCISNGWSSNDETIIDSSSSPNAIERLPLDVFIKIIKLLDPKEVARLTCVCKLLKEIVSDDKLWEYLIQYQNQNQNQSLSTLFAEMYLQHGFPLRRCPVRELSFKHVYGKRAKKPRAIIIDGGAGYYKLGWSNHDSPSVRLHTLAEFTNTGAPIETKVHDIFAKVYKRMHTYPSKQPVIIATPINYYGDSWGQYSDVLSAILFKKGVPAVCIVNQATLAMFSARRTSGILVNIGYSKTEVFPILNGEIMYNKVGVESVFVGGLHLTRYLREQLRQRNLHVSSLSTVRLLKEKLCYVVLDYEAELLKNTDSICRVDSSGSYTLKQERFRTGELLFDPQFAGINERGLHQAVAECINHCSVVKVEGRPNWFKTIVLAGGTARLPGLVERLEKELRDILPPSVSNGIRVIASPYGENAAWHGAKLVSNLSTVTDTWCIKRPPKPKLEEQQSQL